MKTEPSTEIRRVPLQELALGSFVILDLPWFEHPFPFSSFLVDRAELLAQVRALPLDSVRVDLQRSRFVRQPVEQAPLETAAESPAAGEIARREKVARRDRGERVLASIDGARQRAAQAERALQDIAGRIADDPAGVAAASNALLGALCAELLECGEAAVCMLGERQDAGSTYSHSMNVTVLSLLLGKALGFDAARLRVLGLAAVLHDAGRAGGRLTDDPGHPLAGARLAERAGLPDAVVRAIAQHHEAADGSGFPDGLTADRTVSAARVIHIADSYDRMCNPVGGAARLSPYEALAQLYVRDKLRYDADFLARLVRLLGVYPPGSLVELSTGASAMVVAANPRRPLQPVLLVHDQGADVGQLRLIELASHPRIAIRRALRPGELTDAARERLLPGRQVAYYFVDAEQAAR